ncbi:hypothetical protein H7I53_15355 [Mycolicibacterium pulveris]|uniref:Uncharacterized protein n=1 Tax=Mycolicibacterium pulveris TaxID=36813 RepID=A0A7I7UG80_MYCPV|nr:hypothetical protein [Mycolicibacterium pulveris]MCV6981590.1 hypothetical protein [Mycolicibacterium pulveris]BBY80255.1 hypothetical protein MPUL_14130 [Mycolicibacterium pulveris]
MLPTRSTLEGWRPDALWGSSAAVETGGDAVRAAVSSVDDACGRLPELSAWAGTAHDAAKEMFGRADGVAETFSNYAGAVAAAIRDGAASLETARNALLAKANELDTGPLNVTDQWVVQIDPRHVSAEEMADLQALALQEQAAVNAMLIAVGDADDAMANAVLKAGNEFGFVEPAPSTDLAAMMMATAQRPADQVPDPRTVIGLVGQEAMRAADQQQNVREVIESTNEYGEEVTTVIKQDGSKAVATRMDPFEWPSKMNFYQIEEFDRTGAFVATTSSWHDMGNDCDYTSFAYADGSNLSMSMDPTGYVTVGFTTADGHHSAVPVELIDNISLVSTSGMSGLEKHIARGGSLPMVTPESVDKIGKTMKFGGPAVTVATTIFDMVMADSRHDRCVALAAGAAGGLGGWGGAKGGAALGAATGPGALFLVPTLAISGALLAGFGGRELGKMVGDAVCPY